MKGAYVLISLIILIVLFRFINARYRPPMLYNRRIIGSSGFVPTPAEKERAAPTKGLEDYIRAAESGVIKGCIYGYLLGDSITSAIAPAIAYGTISPMMLYMGY